MLLIINTQSENEYVKLHQYDNFFEGNIVIPDFAAIRKRKNYY